MATESTAIHDLLSGFNRKAIPDDPDDDVLFAGSRRRDREVAPKQASPQPRAGMFTMPPPPIEAGSPFAAPPARMASGTQPPPYSHTVIPTAPGVPTMQLTVPPPQTLVPLPQAFVRHPAHAIQGAHGTTLRAGVTKKLYAIPVALFVVAVSLAGVLLTRGDQSPPKVAAAAPTADPVEVAEPEPEPAPAPAAVEPVVAPAPVAAAEPAPVAEPVAAVAPVAAPVAAPAAPARPKDILTPATVVPESAFTAKQHEPTIPTIPAVTATPIEAPKVTPVAVAAREVKAAPAPAKIKKSKRELARERRAARAAKRGTPRVAMAETSAKVAKVAKVAKAEKAGAEDLNGNGALSITSGSPREVWVDGRNSKRMTPLRVLVKPGKHSVTLFDKDHGSAKTFQVEVKPNSTTKISK